MNISKDVRQKRKHNIRLGHLHLFMHGDVTHSNECSFLSLVRASIKNFDERPQKHVYDQGRATKMTCKKNYKIMGASKCECFHRK